MKQRESSVRQADPAEPHDSSVMTVHTAGIRGRTSEIGIYSSQDYSMELDKSTFFRDSLLNR